MDEKNMSPELTLDAVPTLTLDPAADEAAAAAVKGQAETLLKRLRAFAPALSTSGAIDPASPTGGACEGNAVGEESSLAGDGGVQG